MEVLRRGTTPTLTFETPYTKDDIADGWITFKQYDCIVIDKNIADVTFIGSDIVLQMSQKETLKLYDGVCTIQVRLRLKDGNAVASNIVCVKVEDVLKDGDI